MEYADSLKTPHKVGFFFFIRLCCSISTVLKLNEVCMKNMNEMAKKVGNGEIASIAKGFAKDMATKLFLRTIGAAATIRNADKEKLTKALKAGSVVIVGFLIVSKLFGLQVLVALMGGTILLEELLQKIQDESDKAKIKGAFDALKSEDSTQTDQ